MTTGQTDAGAVVPSGTLLAADVLAAMERIVEEHPGSLEYQEDGRYTWPERWQALREWLTANEKAEAPK